MAEADLDVEKGLESCEVFAELKMMGLQWQSIGSLGTEEAAGVQDCRLFC